MVSKIWYSSRYSCISSDTIALRYGPEILSMQRTILQISIITCFSMLWGCDSSGLSAKDQQSASSGSINTGSISTVVQTQSDPVVDQNGAFVVSAERTVELQPQTVALGNSLPYYDRDGFDIKSLHPDFWPNRQELVDANTSGVAVNLLWENWQPTLDTNCTAEQIQHEGKYLYCYFTRN